ncbi:IS66 family insertion sequence element accessory protein TnpB [Shewanella surugensis]|uniref:IS66 family insertion sequence element accessory protein TnpB n=1 Tax=Shewanella surugensis TaxID=212020 RepID=A0ABT0LJC1_9GAMM|nr:IS66 family insertion sequence element accessory protein TnpB [Shewanella surugensis]MCL1127689.1 IS66 family insertion sequence element accessory protein TnpB [Shewanella surugensis]
MIHLTASTKILIATEPADFRKGIDGLSAVCRLQLAKDPRTGTIFVFINRSKTMVRALTYDGTGFWLMTKRLSTGRFQRWPRPNTPLSSMLASQLRQLLCDSNAPLTFIGQ